MEEVLKILHWAPLILWTNDQGRCSERQICPFKKINYLCSCIEHLLPLHLWTQQRRCLKSKHLLPYIYEHNRGGASSQSCTDTEAKNITIHRQSWTPPPLVWIYIHNRGAWIFLLDRFAIWAPPLVNYVHKIRGAQQKISNRGGWDFLLNTSFVFINVRGGGAQCKILSTSSIFWKCEHGPTKQRFFRAVVSTNLHGLFVDVIIPRTIAL